MKRRLLRKGEDSDPMSVVSNLFDVAMVFAVALMVALVSRYNMTEMFSQEDFTMVNARNGIFRRFYAHESPPKKIRR